MKNFLNFILYTNIFIALCAVAMANASLLLLEKESSWLINVILFFGTLTAYNLCSFYEFEAYSAKFSFIKRNKHSLKILVGISVVFLFGTLFWIDINQLVFLIHLAIISVFYTVPIHISKQTKTLFYFPAWRNIPFLKVFLIAYVWASATVIFPTLEQELIVLKQQTVLLFVERFLFILAITLPFDIRDYELDKKSKLFTFATWKSKLFAKIIAILFAVLALSLNFYTFFSFQNSIILVTYVFVFVLILMSNEKRPEWFFTALLDGTMLLPFLLLFLFEKIKFI
jgi:4-hydroxybenzoate polyprenyltransferase